MIGEWFLIDFFRTKKKDARTALIAEGIKSINVTIQRRMAFDTNQFQPRLFSYNPNKNYAEYCSWPLLQYAQHHDYFTEF